VEERRRVEEQEEEQDHRKDPGLARPITLATTSSSRFGVLCEYLPRISFSRLGGGGLEDGVGVGRAVHDEGAVNRYRSHIVYIDVLNEVSVMPARGAQSC
jgi:hypothetical protein